MTNINKIGLGILSLIIVSGIWLVTKGGGSALFGPGAPTQAGLAEGIILDSNSDENIQARIDNLNQLKDVYEQSMDEDLRATARRLILNEARDVDESKLPADLKRFIAEMRKEQKESEQKESEQKEQ